MARPSAKISNGPGLGFKLLGAGLTGTSGANAGIVDQDVEPIRRRLDRTEDLVRPRRAFAPAAARGAARGGPVKLEPHICSLGLS